MKRDMDLVRAILLAVEGRPAESAEVNVIIPDHGNMEVGEHLQLMEDAGLVEGVHLSAGPPICTRLTWQGYEFLESSRKDTLWQKAKSLAMKQTGGLSLVAITEALKAVVKHAIDASN